MELELGKRFGRLSVVNLDHKTERIDKNGKRRIKEYYLCICDCGRTKITEKHNLLSGDCKSCGCLSDENRHSSLTKYKKHGMYNTKLFNRWEHMKDRCYSKNNKSYKNYGGRGIKVCKEWKDNFMSFYNWAISNGYQDNLTIDRIDVNGDYCPENCRWITMKEQNTNKTNNNWVEINGKKDLITNWCKYYNIYRATVYKRLSRGWDIKKAITTPPLIHPKPHA